MPILPSYDALRNKAKQVIFNTALCNKARVLNNPQSDAVVLDIARELHDAGTIQAAIDILVKHIKDDDKLLNHNVFKMAILFAILAAIICRAAYKEAMSGKANPIVLDVMNFAWLFMVLMVALCLAFEVWYISIPEAIIFVSIEEVRKAYELETFDLVSALDMMIAREIQGITTNTAHMNLPFRIALEAWHAALHNEWWKVQETLKSGSGDGEQVDPNTIPLIQDKYRMRQIATLLRLDEDALEDKHSIFDLAVSSETNNAFAKEAVHFLLLKMNLNATATVMTYLRSSDEGIGKDVQASIWGCLKSYKRDPNSDASLETICDYIRNYATYHGFRSTPNHAVLANLLANNKVDIVKNKLKEAVEYILTRPIVIQLLKLEPENIVNIVDNPEENGINDDACINQISTTLLLDPARTPGAPLLVVDYDILAHKVSATGCDMANNMCAAADIEILDATANTVVNALQKIAPHKGHRMNA